MWLSLLYSIFFLRSDTNLMAKILISMSNNDTMLNLEAIGCDTLKHIPFVIFDLAAPPVFTWRPPATIQGEPLSGPPILKAQRRARPVFLDASDLATLLARDGALRHSALPAFPPRPQLLRPWLILLFYYLWSARGAGQLFVTVLTEYPFVRPK